MSKKNVQEDIFSNFILGLVMVQSMNVNAVWYIKTVLRLLTP